MVIDHGDDMEFINCELTLDVKASDRRVGGGRWLVVV